MIDAGFIIMTAFISPFREDRIAAHAIVNESDSLFNRYIDNSAHLYNKKNLLNDWFVVTSGR